MNSSKNTTLLSSTIIIAGVVTFSFANAAFTAAIPAEIIMSIGASLGLLSIAVADYGRTNRSLVPIAALLRPVWNTSPTDATRSATDTTNNPDRLAA